MMNYAAFLKRTYKGWSLILVTAAVLLCSDLSNRHPGLARLSQMEDRNLSRALPGKFYSLEVVYFNAESRFNLLMSGFKAGLKDLGFVEDSNLIMLLACAKGDKAKIPDVLKMVVEHDADLIVPTSTLVLQEAVKIVERKPMDFMYSYTPLEVGAGKSLTEHLPNVTGVRTFPPVKDIMEFILQIFPKARTIGTLYDTAEINSVKAVSVAREVLKQMNVRLMGFAVRDLKEFDEAASDLCAAKVDVVWITGDHLVNQEFDKLIAMTDKARVPVIANDSDLISRGALASVGIGWYSVGYHNALIAARLLNKEDPANIPIEDYCETKITLNKLKAEKMGISFPREILEEATRKGNFRTSRKLKFCLLQYNDSPLSENTREGIIDGLNDEGLVHGKDFDVKILNAQGDIATLSTMVQDIANEKFDLVFVTSTPPLQAVIKQIRTTPVVFTTVADPVSAGAGRSFTEHLPNVTGTSTMGAYDRMPELLRQVMPGIKSVGTLYTPGEANSVRNMELFRESCSKKGIKLIVVPINSSSEVLDAAISLISQKPDAVCQVIDNLTSASFSSIVFACNKQKVPLFGFVSDQVKHGAIAAFCRDYHQAGMDAASQAVRILKGESPAGIPFQLVSRTNLYLNRDAARYFGVDIPQSIVKKAEVVIGK